MGFRRWFGGRSRAATSFLAMTLVPALAFSWLSWRLLELDRATEAQRVGQRLEGAAALVAAALDRRLTGIEEQLLSLASSPPVALSEDAVILRFRPTRVEAYPERRLSYYPIAPPADEAPASAFEKSADLELRQQDYAQALNAYRQITRSNDSRIRAAALVRVGRTLQKMGRFDDALDAYNDLGRLGPVSVAGMPADLLAILKRCDTFTQLHRDSELVDEAARLGAALEDGHWVLDRSSYQDLFGEDNKCGLSAEAELAPARSPGLAMSAAVDWLWQQWRDKGRGQETWRGRESLDTGYGLMLVVWRGGTEDLTALVAGRRYIETEWSSDWKDQGVDVQLRDGDHIFLGRPFPDGTRTAIPNAAAPRLPWTLSVASRNPAGDFAGLAKRRRLLFAGLAMIGMVMVVGGYFTSRATARELAVAQLQSDFVSAVSHEFRTPLTSMRHLTERLAAGAVSSEERRAQYYSVLAHDTERLHRLVESLLDFGRMEAGGWEYHFEETDVAALVTHVVHEFESEIASSGRHLEFMNHVTANAGAAAIRADAAALALAIRNLLDNAVKYSPDSSVVHVELTCEGPRLAIRVRDEGIGVPAAEQKKIFGKFVRGVQAKTLSIKGTGIGLAIVQHIVSAHGGKIEVESEPGRGSTFTIEL
jgi:signal transduction histidine kinase/tetratricopeptide (TPR) repeat protein